MATLLKKRKDSSGEADSFMRWCHNRTTKQNRNCVIAVVGGTGTGKSYTCLRIMENRAKMLNREPDVRNCCRSTTEFMQRLNSGELKRGDVIILEEVGVNVSAREWQSKMNKLINYVFQTFRTQNLIVLLNLPDIRMLDINSQRILHAKIETLGIDFENQRSKFKFKIRKHRPSSGKDWWIFMKIRVGRAIKKIRSMSVLKPSDWLCDAYEKRRKEYTDKLNKEVEDSFLNTDIKKVGEILDSSAKQWTEKMFELQEVYYRLKEKYGKKPIQQQIADELGTLRTTVSKRMQSMDKSYPIWRKSPRKSPF